MRVKAEDAFPQNIHFLGAANALFYGLKKRRVIVTPFLSRLKKACDRNAGKQQRSYLDPAFVK